MTVLVKPLMTVDEFFAWAEGKPERWELFDGVPVAMMSPERVRHGEAKFAVALALRRAIRQACLPCRVLPDSTGVRIDERTCYQPDALVYCGDRLPGDAIEVPNPVIVVEVTSPGSAPKDTGLKVAGYFMVAAVQHYLILDAKKALVIHHRRSGQDRIETQIAREGSLHLDPPGLTIHVDQLFNAD